MTTNIAIALKSISVSTRHIIVNKSQERQTDIHTDRQTDRHTDI